MAIKQLLQQFMQASNWARNMWMQREQLDIAKKQFQMQKKQFELEQERTLWELGPKMTTAAGFPIPMSTVQERLGMKKEPIVSETTEMKEKKELQVPYATPAERGYK